MLAFRRIASYEYALFQIIDEGIDVLGKLAVTRSCNLFGKKIVGPIKDTHLRPCADYTTKVYDKCCPSARYLKRVVIDFIASSVSSISGRR